MKLMVNKLFFAAAILSALVACSGDDDSNSVNTSENTSSLSISQVLSNLALTCQLVETASVTADTNLTATEVGRYVSANDFDTASAEIVSFDSCSDRLYVVNAEEQTVDVLQMDSAGVPSADKQIDLSLAATESGIAIGSANSVFASNGLVAVAIEAANKQEDGIIALYRSDTLALLSTYSAGALPDSIIMSANGRYIITANEGEPSGDYTVDPEGSVTIVDLAAGISTARVTQVDFDDYSGAFDGVRLPNPMGDTSAAEDLEPEYLALIADDSKVVVAMQENNALAFIDLVSAKIELIKGLGVKSWSSPNTLDVTNKDKTFSANSYSQLVGYYMPDTIVSVSIDGDDYLLTANEGDGREYVYETTKSVCDAANHDWDGDDYAPSSAEYTTEEDDCISYTDEARGDDLDVAAAHPLLNNGNDISDGDALGRIKVIFDQPSVAAEDDVYTFGARSFTIWDSLGNVVWDSGDQLAQKAYEYDAVNFNSTNDSNDSADDRSDDKGIEPEAIEVAAINGKTFAFIGLERQGGIMIYDISNPAAPIYVDYLMNRDFAEPVCTAVDEDGECDNDSYNPAAGDLAPESIDYFSRAGKHFIAVGNEVSGTTTIYELTFSSSTSEQSVIALSNKQ